jgi:serine/threonine protein kinase
MRQTPQRCLMGPTETWPHPCPLSTVPSSEQARLFRRAQRIAQLRHPNLVRMLPMPGGAGLAPILSQGRRLSDFTPAGTFKRFELRQVVRLLLDVLSGLSVLHEDVEDGVGFVHGDVSPRNIFVDNDGTARLVPVLSRHWQVEAPMPANGYAAPEFLLSARVDSRADLFSVGVMLGEALTGKPLFPDPALDVVIARLLGGKLLPVLPSPENAWALPLCAIVERAISPYPELRYRSAIELSNALGAALAHKLATPEPDAWQAEAPTLFLALRPAAPAGRSLTPLSSVLDLAPPHGAANAQAKPAAPRRQKQRNRPLALPGRGRQLALGAATLAAGALLMFSLAKSSSLQAASLPKLAAATLAAIRARHSPPPLTEPVPSGSPCSPTNPPPAGRGQPPGPARERARPCAPPRSSR